MQLAVPRIGRLDTLKALQVAWEEDVVNGVKHDSRGVLDVVQTFLRPPIRALLWWGSVVPYKNHMIRAIVVPHRGYRCI